MGRKRLTAAVIGLGMLAGTGCRDGDPALPPVHQRRPAPAATPMPLPAPGFESAPPRPAAPGRPASPSRPSQPSVALIA